MAYVRQQSFLIHDSIARNITLEEKTLNPERLQALVAATGLAQMLEESGETLNKLVLENGRNLSGGQQQRIALARALYRDAGLYLLDEPFNELDRASVRRLQATPAWPKPPPVKWSSSSPISPKRYRAHAALN
jgi:ABC-type bacteriocin/lantibiotic exporter with double-glycine peptidase domain